MANHNDFAGMIKEIEFDEDEPSFHFLNLGETHYPYMLDPGTLPHISGVHGLFKRMDDSLGQETEDQFFDDKQMKDLHLQQNKTVEYENGRATCRERGCQDVEISVVAGTLKQKTNKKY